MRFTTLNYNVDNPLVHNEEFTIYTSENSLEKCEGLKHKLEGIAVGYCESELACIEQTFIQHLLYARLYARHKSSKDRSNNMFSYSSMGQMTNEDLYSRGVLGLWKLGAQIAETHGDVV